MASHERPPGPSVPHPVPTPSAPAGATLDHVGVAVADLEAASAPYRALGLAFEGDAEVAGQAVRVRLFGAGPEPVRDPEAATTRGGPGAGARIELLAPLGDAGPIARFLERRGPGLHHLAFRVADLDREVARLQAEGARFVDPEPRAGLHGSRVVFLHPAWGAGALLELVEPAR